MMMFEPKQYQQMVEWPGERDEVGCGGSGSGSSLFWRILLILSLATWWSGILFFFSTDVNNRSTTDTTAKMNRLSYLKMRVAGGEGAEACSDSSTSSTTRTITGTEPPDVERKIPPHQQSQASPEQQKDLVQYGDSIYRRGGDWDAAPIVIESHKLVFFSVS
jgi:hypothetical protein